MESIREKLLGIMSEALQSPEGRAIITEIVEEAILGAFVGSSAAPQTKAASNNVIDGEIVEMTPEIVEMTPALSTSKEKRTNGGRANATGLDPKTYHKRWTNRKKFVQKAEKLFEQMQELTENGTRETGSNHYDRAKQAIERARGTKGALDDDIAQHAFRTIELLVESVKAHFIKHGTPTKDQVRRAQEEAADAAVRRAEEKVTLSTQPEPQNSPPPQEEEEEIEPEYVPSINC